MKKIILKTSYRYNELEAEVYSGDTLLGSYHNSDYEDDSATLVVELLDAMAKAGIVEVEKKEIE